MKPEDVMAVVKPSLHGPAMQWCQRGKRSVTIESRMDTLGDSFEELRKVWAYDHDLGVGVNIANIDDFPTSHELRVIKIQKLRSEIAALEIMDEVIPVEEEPNA